MYNVNLLENESELSYIWRLGQAKETGLLDMTWPEIACLLNKNFRCPNNEPERGESAYRKRYAEAKKFKSDVFDNGCGRSKEVQDQLMEIQKERVKLSDARVDYNRLIRQEARKESYLDMIKQIICENTSPINIPVHYSMFQSATDLLVHLTDIHCGIEINTWNNTFNQDVLKKRIEKYTSDILDIRGQHGSENAYLIIGEILSGIIHNNLRLQNNMDMMEQFKYVSELIAGMLSRLANHFNQVHVYTTPGNHSRISPKKENSLDGENMDVLLPFYLKARMQNFKNITIHNNTIEPEIAMFNIRGNNVFAAHGHKDSPANVVQNFTCMFGIKPDIVLLGHRHTNGMTTVSNTKIIESGCVSGNDQYAISIRKINRPEQTVSVIGENGLICLYDIQLDK